MNTKDIEKMRKKHPLITEKQKKKQRESTMELITIYAKKAIKKHLLNMKLNETYNAEFGVFKKTAEKELTMTAWIEVPGVDVKTCKEAVKTVAESLGWTFKESPTMQYFGVVSKKKE